MTPLKNVLFRDCSVNLVLLAFGQNRLGALRIVRPHVSAHTLYLGVRNLLC